MTGMPCPREGEVVDAVRQRRWPERCADDLASHVAGCADCSEAVQISTLLGSDYDTAVRDVQLPAAGQVWWRAAVRARLESSRAAARPITWAQAAAGACAAGAAAALATMAWPALWEQGARAAGLLAGLDERSVAVAGSMVSAVARSLPLVAAIASLAVLTPVVVLYLALSDE